jgi:hypothetical protein
MAETGDQPKGEPKPSTLADRLFGRAMINNVGEHLEKAQQDLARGATEQANEHLKRAGAQLAHSTTHMTSPRLSEDENLEWLRLQGMKYHVNKSGMISIMMLDDSFEQRIKFLGRKAFGQDTETK